MVFSIKPCQFCGESFTPQARTQKYCSLSHACLSRITLREPGKCWEWIGTIDKNGYGKVQFLKTEYRAHRAMWQLTNGDIPGGLRVCHHCDNPTCCNPSHLFLGTDKDNHADCKAKGRNVKGTKHGRSKLTEKDVLEIRASSDTQTELARQYGVTQSQIWSICHHHTWRHV